MKRILVPLDSSPRSEVVLAAAAQLAQLTSATLVLYRAITIPPEMPQELFVRDGVQLEDLLLRKANDDLAKLAKTIANVSIEQVAEFATPWDGICRAARDRAADLIVIGSHGYGALDRLLGTTAGKVVNHTDRNVLVVRTPL